jgi:hypothetical protein
LTADLNDYGLLIESSYLVVPDVLQPCVRYELIMAGEARTSVINRSMEEQTNILTARLTWYFSATALVPTPASQSASTH